MYPILGSSHRQSTHLCLWLTLVALAAHHGCCRAEDSDVTDRKVVFITIDGLRWQELFNGADRSLIASQLGGVRDQPACHARFWRNDLNQRRRLLMPFFWNSIVPNGIVYGNPAENSSVRVTNKLYFSYPGYNELLTGFADPKIRSNNKTPNSNITVLEWLNRQPRLSGQVAVFSSWDVFPFIVNQQRSRLFVNAGWELPSGSQTPHLQNLYRELPRVWHNVRYDYLTHTAAADHIRKHHPRVLYVAFGETDDWAHEGRYDLYLDAAFRTDRYIARLWQQLQQDPFYAKKTSLILTTDHGRGDTQIGWKSHGADVPGSDRIWIAMLGPYLHKPQRPTSDLTQAQIAASIAALMGEDYCAFQKRAALPIPGIRHPKPQAAIAPPSKLSNPATR